MYQNYDQAQQNSETDLFVTGNTPSDNTALNPITMMPFSRHANNCIRRTADDKGIASAQNALIMRARTQLTQLAIQDAVMLEAAAYQMVQMVPSARRSIDRIMNAYARSTAEQIYDWR